MTLTMINITALPAERPALMTMRLATPAGKPRHVEYIIDGATARELRQLKRTCPLSGQFTLEPTGKRIAFMSVDRARYDLVHEAGQHTWSVLDIVVIHDLDEA